MSADEFDVTFADGYVTPGRRKNNWLASNTPTAAHGSNFRFEVGSVWVYTSNIWVCTDPTTGAAVWTQIDGSGGGGGGFTNPMTTAEDIIKGGAGGSAVRHAVGTEGQVLTVVSGAVAWADDDDPDPASTVESETSFGISAAVGTDVEYARQDHTHGTPSLGTTPSTQDFGDSPSGGSATTAAKTDHTHGMPANPVTAAAVEAVGRWEPVQYDDGSSPWPFVYADDEIVVAFVEE